MFNFIHYNLYWESIWNQQFIDTKHSDFFIKKSVINVPNFINGSLIYVLSLFLVALLSFLVINVL